MAATDRDDRRLSPQDLEGVLAKARAEQWQELALLGPRYDLQWQREQLVRQGWNPERIVALVVPL